MPSFDPRTLISALDARVLPRFTDVPIHPCAGIGAVTNKVHMKTVRKSKIFDDRVEIDFRGPSLHQPQCFAAANPSLLPRTKSMKYAVVVFETEDDFQARSDHRAPEYMGAYGAYYQMLKEAGVEAGGAGLMPPSETTSLKVTDGERQVQDGPFAEAKEQIGGMFVIDVDDLDAALEWASKCPAATRAGVEVRPLMPPMNEQG